AAEGRLSAEPDEEASAAVVREALSAIRGLPFAVGAGAIASYLIGHGSSQVRKYEWQTRPQFGLLRDRNETWVRRLLRRFLAAGALAIDAERQTLHITRRGAWIAEGTRPNEVRLPPVVSPSLAGGTGRAAAMRELDGGALSLFERLKKWRRDRADADGVPAYVVCHDATLAAIADARPQSGEDLIRVPGMGAAKLQKYGVQILTEVRAHLSEHPEDAARPSPAVQADAVPEHLRRTDEDGRRWSEHQLQVRAQYPRAWEPWTDEEDATLRAMFAAGAEVDAISAALQRQPHAVTMRAEKLGLIEAAPAPAT
ncbi:MAG TPA: HRDC domain-containing protein, partial [Dehalococcoidia bacterium]|nr:HRDC domain-containing protein [Dehalococcoidia bacterium]